MIPLFVSRTAIVLVAMLPLALRASANATSPSDETFSRAHVGGGQSLQVLRRPDGLVSRVGGRFHTSLSVAGGALTESALRAAALSFIAAHSPGFGLPANFEPAAVMSFTSVRTLVGNITILRGSQHWRGIPVRGGEVVLGFASDGTLVFFNGTLFPNASYVSDADFGLDALNAANVVATRTTVRTPLVPVTTDRGTVWRSRAEGPEGPVDMWQEADPESGIVVWIATDYRREWVVDPINGLIMNEAFRPSPAEENRAVRHAKIDENGAQWKFPHTASGVPNESYTWERVYVHPYTGGNCFYYLMSDQANYGIWPQVTSVSEAEHIPFATCDASPFNGLPCPSNFSCTESDAARSRQQNAYVKVRQALTLFSSLVYPYIAPTTGTAATQLWVDVPQTTCGAGAPGCFWYNSWNRWIEISNVPTSTQLLWHEAGHYFHYLYAHLGSACVLHSDESISVKEAIADAVADMVYREQLANVASYNHEGSGLRHTASTFESYASFTWCPSDGHLLKGPFVQAFWEVSWGLNCTVPGRNCNTDFTTLQSDIGWSSLQHARRSLLKGIAWTMSVLPSSYTYPTVAANLFTYLYYNESPAIAFNAASVFSHHGM